MSKTLKPTARAHVSPLGWRHGGVQEKAGALYMAANESGPLGATAREIKEYGLLPCLNMINGPDSVPVNQTVVGRGHIAWSQGPKGSKRYYIALCLDAIPMGAKVPPYYRKHVLVAGGETGEGCPDGVSIWTQKQLRAWLAANRS
jgi:hypothetical protein